MGFRCIVIADKNNKLITPAVTNPNWGWITIQTLPEDEFDKIEIRTVRQASSKERLNRNYQVGKILVGKIILEDGLTPFNPNYPRQDYKYIIDKKTVSTLQGKPIYRRLYWEGKNLSAQDIVIEGDGFIDITRDNDSTDNDSLPF